MRNGFTLLELLLVMVLMAFILGISLSSFYNMRRGAEMRGAIASVRSTLALARQHAVTQRETVYVTFRQADSCFMVSNAVGLIGTTNYLPLGVYFNNIALETFQFRPNGGAGTADNKAIEIKEKVGGQVQTVKIFGLTGLTRVE